MITVLAHEHLVSMQSQAVGVFELSERVPFLAEQADAPGSVAGPVDDLDPVVAGVCDPQEAFAVDCETLRPAELERFAAMFP